MIKIGIVEDEPFVQRCIKEDIAWSECNAEVIFACFNGLEAIEHVKKACPDIIIADIQMPGMDGITLMERMHETNPEIKFIILSGYEVFEYAKKAVNLGACAYILKPVDPNEILNTVRETAKGITTQNQRERNLLKEILRGDTSADTFRTMQDADHRLNKLYYCIAALDISGGFSPEIRKRLLEVRDIFTQYPAVSLGGHRELFVGYCEEEAEAEKIGQKIATDLLIHFGGISDSQKSCTIGVSKVHMGLDGLYTASFEAIQTLNLRYAFPTQRLFYANQQYDIRSSIHFVGSTMEDKIIRLIINRDSENLHSFIEDTFRQFEQEQIGIYGANDFVRSMVYKLFIRLEDTGISLDSFVDDNSDAINLLYTCSSIEQLKEALSRFVDIILPILTATPVDSVSKIIDEGKRYIEDNISSPDLNLSHVAEHVHLNASYFCTLFSKNCGITLINYINQRKIEKAKLMLLNGENKIGTVAIELGFQNSTYFSYIFKKMTGLSPSEFRKPSE